MYNKQIIENKKNNFDISKLKIAIVKSNYNSSITDELYKGTLETLKANGLENIFLKEVSGVYELGIASIDIFNKNSDIDGIIALGCVIKGDTQHDFFINNAISNGFMKIMLKYKKPIGFGVLTVDNMQQAIDRTNETKGNKGVEVAIAILNYFANDLKKV